MASILSVPITTVLRTFFRAKQKTYMAKMDRIGLASMYSELSIARYESDRITTPIVMGTAGIRTILRLVDTSRGSILERSLGYKAYDRNVE